MGSAFDAYARLSKQIAGEPTVALARPKFTQAESTLRKIVKSLGLTINHEEANGAIGGEFDLLGFFEALYDSFGFTDYYLTVTLIEKVQCTESSGRTDCWRMNVRYTPSELQSETLQGTREELAADLAVFIMRGVVQNRGDEWRAETKDDPKAAVPFLFAVDTPSSMERLQATSEGLQLLAHGCTDADTNVSRDDCLARARERLLRALGEQAAGRTTFVAGGNPPAALGLALLELYAAIRKAQRGAPVLVVEKKLWEMEKNLKKARASQFLRQAIEPNGAPKFEFLFGRVDVDAKLLLEPKAEQFSCALSQYRRANWMGCLSETTELSILPEPVRPYFEAARFDAWLYQYESQEEEKAAKRTLAELKLRINAIEDGQGVKAHSWPLRLVEYRHRCDLGDYDDATLDELKDELRVRLPSHNQRKLASVQMYGYQGIDIAEEKAVELIEHFAGAADSYEREILHFELARHYAQRGRLQQAVDEGTKTVSLPWVIEAFRNHPDFHLIASDADAMVSLLDAREDLALKSDLEACSEPEIH